MVLGGIVFVVAAAAGAVDLASDLQIDDIDAIAIGRRPSHAEPHTIFINFDGAQLGGGNHSSQNNTTGRGQCVGSFPAYGGTDTQTQAVVQATQQDWSAFAVTITGTRPAAGNYTMVMSGNWGSCCGSGGVAPVVCGTDNLNTIAFSCQGATSPLSSSAQAGVISQEAAHTFGLMHVNDSSELMNPSISQSADPSFKDVCYGSYSPVVCTSQHTCEGGGQNSVQELLMLFGPSIPDTAAPTVAIVSPMDGDVFDVGASFAIEADAADDVGIRDVTLFVNEMGFHALSAEPFSWDVDGIPAGLYEMYVVATDAAGNETESSMITIAVGDEEVPSDESSGGAGGSEGGTGHGEGSGGAVPPGFGGSDDAAAGCGCANSRNASWWLALLFFCRRRSKTPRSTPVGHGFH